MALQLSWTRDFHLKSLCPELPDTSFDFLETLNVLLYEDVHTGYKLWFDHFLMALLLFVVSTNSHIYLLLCIRQYML